jgi:hypothetical protein
MRTSALLALSYLSTAVRAGGYQGCLERVWLYQAYEIDGLNAPDDQTLGFKCTRFDEKKKVCVGDWVPCKPKTGPGDRCSYDDFISHLGKALMARGWRVPETGEIDTEATARKCFEVYTKRVNKVKNFPPYVVGKGQIEFNDLIKMVKDVVNKAYREKGTEDNKHLWESFDETTDKILIARTGDRTYPPQPHAVYASLSDVVMPPNLACPFSQKLRYPTLLPRHPFSF